MMFWSHCPHFKYYLYKYPHFKVTSFRPFLCPIAVNRQRQQETNKKRVQESTKEYKRVQKSTDSKTCFNTKKYNIVQTSKAVLIHERTRKYKKYMEVQQSIENKTRFNTQKYNIVQTSKAILIHERTRKYKKYKKVHGSTTKYRQQNSV